MKYVQELEYGDFDSLTVLEQKRLLLAQLLCLVQFNRAWLEVHPGAPLLYDSGVTFLREPDGAINLWTSIPLVLARRESHCVGLSCWRVAELRHQGEDAQPFLQVFHEDRPGFGLVTEFHVTVVRGDGETHEDPSRKLGMP